MSGGDTGGVRLERLGAVARVTLDRPQARNSLGLEFTAEMNGALDAIDADEEIAAVVLRGVGDVFCSGGDLRELMDPTTADPARDLRYIRGYNLVVGRLRRLDRPVVAAVNGPAVGGGAALALACDLAIAAEHAAYVFAFGRIGLTGADMGCAYLLPRVVGPVRAAHLMLTAGTLSAAEGRQLGAFLDVVPAAELDAAALELARAIATGPRHANAATKLALRRGETTDLAAVLDYEAYVQTVQFSDPEHKQRLGDALGLERRAR